MRRIGYSDLGQTSDISVNYMVTVTNERLINDKLAQNEPVHFEVTPGGQINLTESGTPQEGQFQGAVYSIEDGKRIRVEFNATPENIATVMGQPVDKVDNIKDGIAAKISEHLGIELSRVEVN